MTVNGVPLLTIIGLLAIDGGLVWFIYRTIRREEPAVWVQVIITIWTFAAVLITLITLSEV